MIPSEEQSELLSWLRAAPRRSVGIQYTPKGNTRKNALLQEYPEGYAAPRRVAGTVLSSMVLPMIEGGVLTYCGNSYRNGSVAVSSYQVRESR